MFFKILLKKSFVKFFPFHSYFIEGLIFSLSRYFTLICRTGTGASSKVLGGKEVGNWNSHNAASKSAK